MSVNLGTPGLGLWASLLSVILFYPVMPLLIFLFTQEGDRNCRSVISDSLLPHRIELKCLNNRQTLSSCCCHWLGQTRCLQPFQPIHDHQRRLGTNTYNEHNPKDSQSHLEWAFWYVRGFVFRFVLFVVLILYDQRPVWWKALPSSQFRYSTYASSIVDEITVS